MQIDAETLQTLLIAAFGATAAIYGDRGIRRLRNGRSKPECETKPSFSEQAQGMPGFATECKERDKRMSRMEARLAALEGTNN